MSKSPRPRCTTKWHIITLFQPCYYMSKSPQPPMYTQMTYSNTFSKLVTICQNHHTPDVHPNWHIITLFSNSLLYVKITAYTLGLSICRTPPPPYFPPHPGPCHASPPAGGSAVAVFHNKKDPDFSRSHSLKVITKMHCILVQGKDFTSLKCRQCFSLPGTLPLLITRVSQRRNSMKNTLCTAQSIFHPIRVLAMQVPPPAATKAVFLQNKKEHQIWCSLFQNSIIFELYRFRRRRLISPPRWQTLCCSRPQ